MFETPSIYSVPCRKPSLGQECLYTHLAVTDLESGSQHTASKFVVHERVFRINSDWWLLSISKNKVIT